MPKLCPLMKEPCIEHGCAWYKHVLGMHPQTGVDLDHWECAVTLQNELIMENSRQQRQTGAAVESFRNEVVAAKGRDQLIEMARVFPAIEAQG